MTQPKVSGYMRRTAKVETLELFERIADGLNMPDHARIALGLAPKAGPATANPAVLAGLDIPPRNTRPALPAAAVSGLISADAEYSEEDESSV